MSCECEWQSGTDVPDVLPGADLANVSPLLPVKLVFMSERKSVEAGEAEAGEEQQQQQQHRIGVLGRQPGY